MKVVNGSESVLTGDSTPDKSENRLPTDCIPALLPLKCLFLLIFSVLGTVSVRLGRSLGYVSIQLCPLSVRFIVRDRLDWLGGRPLDSLGLGREPLPPATSQDRQAYAGWCGRNFSSSRNRWQTLHSIVIRAGGSMVTHLRFKPGTPLRNHGTPQSHWGLLYRKMV